MKHASIYHSVHVELGCTDTAKSSTVSSNNFVFIALCSVSFVMTAAKSPHYSALCSLLSITSQFPFCPHPFTHALLPWQNLKVHISRGTGIHFLFPRNQAYSTFLHSHTSAGVCILSIICFSYCTFPLAVFHRIWPRALKTVLSCTGRALRLTRLPLFIHPHIVSMQVFCPALASGCWGVQLIKSHQRTVKSTQNTPSRQSRTNGAIFSKSGIL